MELLRAVGVERAFGPRPILAGCDLSVDRGERIGLVGANGCGKSTLLRILGGESPDHGTVSVRGRVSLLEQDPVVPGATVGEAADEAVRWHAELLLAYQAALAAVDMRRAEELQHRLDEVGWEIGHRVDAMLSRVGAPPREASTAKLSGGERRRVALARALLGDPDVLLLDEPTNHLDADTVEWLQGFLAAHRGAVVIVTHDRYLLEAVATRIVEVEDGVCTSYDGSYADYLIERAERRAVLERGDDVRLAMIAREAEWASRSPAARSTKQKARLDRLAALQALPGLRRAGAVELDLRTGLKHGSTVLEMRALRKSLGGRALFRGFELALRAGDRVGVLGPNGCGKTTLLGMMQGAVLPDAGEIVRGARVRMAVLDQGRTGLDPAWTVYEAAGGGNDQVRVGDRWIHVTSFLSRFLFGRDFLTRRVEALSGGERARLLLARLLLHGANLLLLDEPTNDLDLTTLRVLEEALLAYDGVLVVVTHDRAFLDRVCNAVVASEGEGSWVRYASRQQQLAAAARAPEPEERETRQARPARVRTRLSWAERGELTGLPARIEALEGELAALGERLADPASYRDGGAPDLSRRASALPAEIEALYTRWSELEARAESG